MHFSKRVLLTGAGFAKSFGGFLGIEMHQRLYNLSNQRGITLLTNRLLKTEDYEHVLGKTLNDVSPREELWHLVQNAIRSLYQELDEAFLRWGDRRETALRTFLINFLGNHNECGFVFTLNQDLLLERWWRGTPSFCLPGLTRSNGDKVYLSDSTMLGNVPFNRDESRQLFYLPDKDDWEKMNLLDECTQFNYIKLHGSMNFVSKIHGKEVVVIGTDKSSQIAREPLLNEGYASLFEKVLCSGMARLLVVGYGFQDEHINRILGKALKHHDLSVFVMDPTQGIVEFANKFADPRRPSNKLRPGFDWPAQQCLSRVSGFFRYDLLKDVFPDATVTDFPQWNEMRSRYFS
jgi:hypothetical protein